MTDQAHADCWTVTVHAAGLAPNAREELFQRVTDAVHDIDEDLICTGQRCEEPTNSGIARKPPGEEVDVNLRGVVLDVAMDHWQRSRDNGVPTCACGRKVADINEHIADEVLIAIIPYIGLGLSVFVRRQYGEQLPSGRVLEIYGDAVSGDQRVTHYRRLFVERDWTPAGEDT